MIHLAVIHSCIVTAKRQKLCMRAGFQDPSLLYNKDLVCVPDRRKSVGYGNDRTGTGNIRDRFLNLLFCFDIHGSRGFVKNNDGSPAENSPCDSDPLLLPSA